jgi:hypothetical protein
VPYQSDVQRRFFHAATSRRAGISAATVAEFDNASRGKKLPKRKGSKMKMKPKGTPKRSFKQSAARLAAARTSRKKSGSKGQRHYAASMAAGRG